MRNTGKKGASAEEEKGGGWDEHMHSEGRSPAAKASELNVMRIAAGNIPPASREKEERKHCACETCFGGRPAAIHIYSDTTHFFSTGILPVYAPPPKNF